jgi:hypothetical protein
MGWPLASLQPGIQMNVNNSRDHGAELQVSPRVSRANAERTATVVLGALGVRKCVHAAALLRWL